MIHRQFNFTFHVLLGVALGVMLLGAIYITATPAHAQTTAKVSISPGAQAVATQGSVDIIVENVSNLYGMDVQLSFAPAIAAIQDANTGQTGIQITPGPLLTSGSGGYWTIRNTADNSAGTVWLAMMQLNPSAPVNGSGVFATITFNRVVDGSSPINFTSVMLSDPNGFEIPATSTNGNITFGIPTAVRLASFDARTNDWLAHPGVIAGGIGILIVGGSWLLRRARGRK